MARNGLVDVSRLLAAFGIVWFHSEAAGARIGYAAVPFFLVLLSLPSQGGLTRRARRLLVPFVIWSGVYAAFRVLTAWRLDLPLFGWWQDWMVLTGTSVHLWFLPFAFLVALAAPAVRGRGVALVLPVVAAGLVALTDPKGFPWYQWSFGLVPALVGLAWARAGWVALLPLAAAFAVLEVFRPHPDNLIILAGAALAIGVLFLPLPATKVSDWCARVSLPVYLVHVLVLNQAAALGLEGAAAALFGIAGSLTFAVAMELVRRGR